MEEHPKIDLAAGPGHRPADEHLVHLQLGRSFLAGPHASQDIIRLRWYVRETDDALVGKVWFGPGAQGPPGHAHGGSMAAVLDEALGSACWVAGHSVVAAELDTKFLRMLPLEHVYTVEAWIERVEGRRFLPVGRIVDEEETVYCTATGIFVEISKKRFESLADRFG